MGDAAFRVGGQRDNENSAKVGQKLGGWSFPNIQTSPEVSFYDLLRRTQAGFDRLNLGTYQTADQFRYMFSLMPVAPLADMVAQKAPEAASAKKQYEDTRFKNKHRQISDTITIASWLVF
jgi:hypothetical protein